MTAQTGFLLNEIVIYIVLTIWGILLSMIIICIFKKDFLKAKKVLLYTFNSLVFVAGPFFYVRLGIIVQGPKEDTFEKSMMVLKNRCIEEFGWYLSVSVLITLFLVFLNILYQRHVLKKVNKKEIIVLALIDFSLLIFISLLAVLNYYLGISEEISHYHKMTLNMDS